MINGPRGSRSIQVLVIKVEVKSIHSQFHNKLAYDEINSYCHDTDSKVKWVGGIASLLFQIQVLVIKVEVKSIHSQFHNKLAYNEINSYCHDTDSKVKWVGGIASLPFQILRFIFPFRGMFNRNIAIQPIHNLRIFTKFIP